MIDFLLMSEKIEPKDEIPPNTTKAIAVKIPTKVINWDVMSCVSFSLKLPICSLNFILYSSSVCF